MTTTTTTTYTKGGLGCCLTFTLDGQPRAIDGDVGAHAYDQVDDIEWVGPPERVGDHPPVYRRGATTSSLRPLKSRPVEADDPIAVLRARDRGATTLSEVVGEMMASR